MSGGGKVKRNGGGVCGWCEKKKRKEKRKEKK
jgi:hypothetical protein